MRGLGRFRFLLALGLVAAPAAALAQAPAPKKVATVEGITEYRLDNGLRVLLFPDASQPKVTVNLTVLVGSRHEGYGESGMAHLLEHMVFKGTPAHPDIPGAMKERGAQFNGSTWVDRTNYFETLPASDENLEFALALEADRMINSPIKAEDLATEFSVVRNEFERGENSPNRVLSQRMTAVAYEWHNYGKSTIGNRSDIERVPVDALRAFYQKYYQPDNAVLVVAGRFEEAKALELIQKTFGAIPKPDRTLPATYTEEPPQDGERSVTLRRVGDVGIVGVMYHIPSATHPEYPALQVLARILSTEPSGRLYKALVETKKAASASAGASAYHDPGLIEMEAEVSTKDPKALESVRDAIFAVLEEVKSQGVTQEEVDRARQQILKQRELAAADSNGIAVQLSEWAAQGDWRLYFLSRDLLEKVTPDQVKDVAVKYLEDSNRTVGFFIPSAAPERTPVPQAPAIASLVEGYKGRAATAAGEAFDVAPLAIQARVQTPAPIEGVKVALLPKKTRGEDVRVVLNLRYGDAESLKPFVAAADFLPELMLRGTKNLTRQQIQDALDKNVARLGGGGGLGSASFTIQTKRANLPAVLEILRQVLREPILPADELEILKRETITRLEAGRSEPTSLGSNLLARTLDPRPADDVRYTPTPDEQIARVGAVTIDQVKSLYADFLGASQGELAIVGDFDPAEVRPVLEKALAGWKSGKPYARIERSYVDPSATGRQTIETPDKANAAYFAGLGLPLKDSDPDYPALVAGNYILGGGSLSSRIADRLRQKGGLSYSAAAQFSASALDPRANLFIFAIYNPQNVDKVVTGAQEEVDRLIAEGVTPDELARAQKGYLQQAAVRRANDGALTSKLADNLYLGRTLQFDADLEAAIAGLTPAQVSAVMKKHIDPKKLTVITAGDFKANAPAAAGAAQ